MSDTTTDPGPVEDTVPTEAAAEDAKPDREAARYRRQLREAETARDTLAARVTKYQTAEAERLATGPGRLLDPTDLWRATDLASVVDDDGEIDPEKVTAAVDELVTAKPHYRQPDVAHDSLDLGVRGLANQKADPDWGDLLRGSTRAGRP